MTEQERQESEEVRLELEALGNQVIYSGGEASKGHGFWIAGLQRYENPRSTWWSVSECKQFLKNWADHRSTLTRNRTRRNHVSVCM